MTSLGGGLPEKDSDYHCFSAKQGTVKNIQAEFHFMQDMMLETIERVDELTTTVQASISQQQSTSSITSFNSFYEWRGIDGTGNNLAVPTKGRAGENLVRVSAAQFDPDEEVALRGASNPNPRVVSNSICQGDSAPNSRSLSNLVWIWGQFLDHEMDQTPQQEAGNNPETLDIVSDPDDPNEDYPNRTIPFRRSQFSGAGTARQFPNIITSFIDASNVYGSDTTRMLALRRLDGTGKLKTSVADNGEVMPPYNTFGLTNDGLSGQAAASLFAAGDTRANENTALLGIHTVWLREHNRLCDQILTANPTLAGQDEAVFQHARRMVAGMMQQITFGEFLPALLGSTAVSTYTGYDPTANAGVSVEFSTVGYRIGHTMLSSALQLGTDSESTVLLRDIFFDPPYAQANGVDAILKGASLTLMQEVDGILVEDVRSFLFGAPTMEMMHDLAALNIQRGRDHGIVDYNSLRQAYGLSAVASFDDLPTTQANKTKLEALYDTVNDIDPWVGGIVETHVAGSSVGPLFRAILVDQFERVRNGDRYWFENDDSLTSAEKSYIRSTTLAEVLTRNTAFTFSGNAFIVS